MTVKFKDDFWYLPNGKILKVKRGNHADAVWEYFRNQEKLDRSRSNDEKKLIIYLFDMMKPMFKGKYFFKQVISYFEDLPSKPPLRDELTPFIEEKDYEGFLDRLDVGYLIKNIRPNGKVKAKYWRQIAFDKGWIRHAGGEGDQIGNPTRSNLNRLANMYYTALQDVPNNKEIQVDFTSTRNEKSGRYKVGEVREGISISSLVRSSLFGMVECYLNERSDFIELPYGKFWYNLKTNKIIKMETFQQHYEESALDKLKKGLYAKYSDFDIIDKELVKLGWVRGRRSHSLLDVDLIGRGKDSSIINELKDIAIMNKIQFLSIDYGHNSTKNLMIEIK